MPTTYPTFADAYAAVEALLPVAPVVGGATALERYAYQLGMLSAFVAHLATVSPDVAQAIRERVAGDVPMPAPLMGRPLLSDSQVADLLPAHER